MRGNDITPRLQRWSLPEGEQQISIISRIILFRSYLYQLVLIYTIYWSFISLYQFYIVYIFLIVIRLSDGDVKPGGPLGAFREEQAMKRHRISPPPFLSSSSHTTQLLYTNSYTYSYPKLNFLQYTIQILIPHEVWSAQVMRDSKIDHTQRHISVLRVTRSA